MFRSMGQFDKLLEKATSHVLMDPEWTIILQLCDLIRQNDVQPKQAVNSVKKKLTSTNQYTVLYALLVLESMVKNCGAPVQEELFTQAFCDTLYELAKTTSHDKVRLKLLEMIQEWNMAFRKNPKYGVLKDLMAQMKSDGFKFPSSGRESDAMFSADSAPQWASGDSCHRCRVQFSIINRKHHCRACGQVFCGQCSSKTATVPKFGFEKLVRVCDACYDTLTKPSSGGPSSKAVQGADSKQQEFDLPAEYLNSSLAQQSQVPPRKSEDELREEEELQLALAISQSEAEAKEKDKFKPLSTYKASVEQTPSPAVMNVHVQDEEQPTNPELARYLNRSYWESLGQTEVDVRSSSPSAPATAPISGSGSSTEAANKLQANKAKENGVAMDNDLEDFIKTLKSQVEIFINRMKSNSSRGRSIANDSSVQGLFMSITAMHSKLLRYIQTHDDSRLHYERLQDKLTQVKDARAALDDLRDEHRDKLRREAEEADRQRQMQMAHKLELMRKKKQEYLQYQRQLALQRIQEQEREMQMRQEHQKQQYLMGYIGAVAGAAGSGGGQFPSGPNQPLLQPPQGYPGYHQYGQPVLMPPPQPQPPQMGHQMQHHFPHPSSMAAGYTLPTPQHQVIPMGPPQNLTQQYQQQQPPTAQANVPLPAPQTIEPQNSNKPTEATTAQLISFDD